MANILERFRSLSGLTEAQFSDYEVENDAEPVVISEFNHMMDETETITEHDTGDALKNEILSYLVSAYAYRQLFLKRKLQDKSIYDIFEQEALRLMNLIDPSKIAFDSNSMRYYPRWDRRGKPVDTAVIGVIA